MRGGGVAPAGVPSSAGAVFVGATRYTSPAAWLRLGPRWRAMVAQMRRMPGYVHHQVYYDPPFTLGTVGYFETRDDLMRFARSGAHRDLMRWVTDGTDNATGGYIRVYELDRADGVGRPDRADD